jgi:hypothetical protein
MSTTVDGKKFSSGGKSKDSLPWTAGSGTIRAGRQIERGVNWELICGLEETSASLSGTKDARRREANTMKRIMVKRYTLIAATALLVVFWSAYQPAVAVRAASTSIQQAEAKACGPPTICIDGGGIGRIFEGIGGLSAGAASRFLIDYPEPYKSQILDYLFKPYYGASLHDLKVEIGGDTNSTWGSEPSHMHRRGDENYQRGYEWWLMREARKRNPKIVIGILPWGAPGWVGNHHFYSQDMIDYELKFINAAHDIHGVDVNHVGIWNESRYDKAWIKLLKSAVLDNNVRHGLSNRVVAAEAVNDWQLANEMNADPALLAAVDVVGVHYPAYSSSPSAQNPAFGSSPSAQNLKRGNTYVPLWDSEDSYSICPEGVCLGKVFPDTVLARMLNRNYIVGKMTKTIHCTIAAAFPAFLAFKEGLVLATSPWSGHYEVSPALWAVAHTTQFAQPGWQYIDSASGLLQGGGGKVVGSYVTLKSPNNSDYSIIIETADATTDQQLDFRVTNGLSSGAVHVWHSNIKARTYFVQEPDLPGGGSYRLTLQPGSIYSLTTTKGPQKGNPGASPADSPFPFPLLNSFESEALDQPPKYFVDQEGSFEVASCTGRPGKCMVQMVDQPPIAWGGGLNVRFPLTFLGDQVGSKNWTDCQVSVDVLMEEFGSVSLWGRADHVVPCTEDEIGCVPTQNVPDGYSLNVDSEGRWSLSKSFDKGATVTRIQSGVLTGWSPQTWHKLKLAFSGSSIGVLIDGKPVIASYVDSGRTHAQGMVVLGTEWNKVQFDNFCLSTVCP